jgi:YebC/PmpR family DNA-binding regulatory protein
MSGHSKWATTKRAKAITDAKRSASFTKVTNLITMSARDKGGDPSINFSLRIAIEKARAVNMPKDNIERAIKRGTGELGGNAIEELYYEGVGPAQVQFIIKCVTDSRNRAAASVRHAFSKHGGSLGSVLWNFDQRGVIRLAKSDLAAKGLAGDDFELELIDAGVDAIEHDDDTTTMYTALADFQRARQFLESKGLASISAEIEYVAKERVELSEDELQKVESFTDVLDEDEDVSDYYTNIK